MPTPHYYFCCLGPAAEHDDDKKRLGYVSLLGARAREGMALLSLQEPQKN